jgi:CBS-domain-containing membrane protein
MNEKAGERVAFWSQVAGRFTTDRHLIDPKFLRNRRRYAFQCSLVVFTMLVVLLFLDTVYQTVLIAALGASSVAAFLSPNMRASRPRCLIGGYLIAVIVGCGLSMLVGGAGGLTGVENHTARVLVGALATGVTMFLMAVTDTEHPTAAAIALGFVLNEWDLMTVAGVMSGITTISVAKELVRNKLIDLL